MQFTAIDAFRHNHDYSFATRHHETRTRWVVTITSAMMIAELVIGTLTGSMALTADGWHMATHAGALGLSAAAYWFARTRASEGTFTFGTGKVYALAGYTSAVILGIVALLMIGESAGLVILKWGVGLCQGAARQLLDVLPLQHPGDGIRKSVEAIDDARIADLHLWELGPGQLGCIVSIVTATPRDTAFYRDTILGASRIAHLTVEVRRRDA